MRKLFFSLFTMLCMTTLVLAVEVTVVKYDKEKKELTVKDDKDKETTYKLTDKTKITVTDKDGKDTEGKLEDIEKRFGGDGNKGKGGKGGKGGGNRNKIDITEKDGTVTELKMKAFGGKGKNDN